jgi:AGCS family alanine or glycine:cation symporter
MSFDGFMSSYNQIMDFVIGRVIWNTPTFVVLLATGILLSLWSKFIQFRSLTHGVQLIRGKYHDKNDPGAISPFQALSAALSGTVGLGNIGGVAMAIGVGGPGALFWMWMTGFLGMAIKATEVTLAMMYRDTTEPENPHGGAMYVIKRGFGDEVGGWAKPVAWAIGALFCVTLLISTATGGNMFQAWNVADITNQYFGVPSIVTGIVLALMTGIVILGGIKRIGDVAGRLVPLMCGLYLLAGLAVLVVEAANIPALLMSVVREAFSPTTAGGAFLGATAWFGLTTGLRRALFSNEAGQGTSPIAHCAAKTNEPASEGIVAGLEPFVDTCLVCTLTALVILCTGTWNREAVGPFGAEIAIAERDGAWAVDAPTSVEHLPELPSPDYWAPGNGFFLIAEVADTSSDTGTRLAKVTGSLVSSPTDPKGLEIVWDPPPEGARLVDSGIHRNLIGAALTGHAFDRAIPGLGKWLVTLACWLFAFSTLISWSYYGEQGVVYLFGSRAVMAYKVIFCLCTVVVTLPGFISSDAQLGNLSDLGTGVMLFANVPIVLAMAYRAMRVQADYFRRLASGEIKPTHDALRITDLVEGKED